MWGSERAQPNLLKDLLVNKRKELSVELRSVFQTMYKPCEFTGWKYLYTKFRE